jgi:O-antigen ligase
LFVGLVAAGLQFEYVSKQFETMGDVYLLLSNFDLRMDLSAFETSGSNLARLYILLFTIRMTMAHPLFGVGTGRWHEALAQTANTGKLQYTIGAHSEYQRFAVENGLTGLILYVTSWVVAFRQAVRLYRTSDPGMRSDTLTVIGVVVFGALINLFLGGGALNILYFALATGLLVGVENDKTAFAHR